ncbi:MAG: phosphoglycerate dehydrogenase [Chitinophagaceae bacterium]|nr:phosphoglycerate dehydrogenase [Chitinophagaceae bacterium]
MSLPYLIIDFDSTFITVETLDILCEMVYDGRPEKESILAEIDRITRLGMEGRISLRESLHQRIGILKAHRSHIAALTERLQLHITPSIERNRSFFIEHPQQVYIVSNGFKECILPIAASFGMTPDHVIANEFQFDEQGYITGVVSDNPLSENKGKAIVTDALQLQGKVVAIGDGITDYEIRQQGAAHVFYAFVENVSRPAIIERADKVAPNFDEILYDLSLKASLSYPKNRIQVLLLENVHPVAVDHFRREGYEVIALKEALNEDELCERIKSVSILGIRSKTQVSEKVLQQAGKLMAIGTFCIGTNQIDLNACTDRGIAVFNAPYSNTRSVVELALGEMIMLLRRTFEKSSKLHDGIWDKKADHSVEIRGKKLGIVGYGNIGSQLSVLAEALGMQVYFYDIIDKQALGNARKCHTLDELLSTVDIVSLHVDGREENTRMIHAERISKMKPGVIFLNLARGHLVDMKAFHRALTGGHIRGAAVDVFPYEPKSNDEIFQSELQHLPNVILTPHIGGSTEEAQENIGHFVPGKLIQYINTGSTYGSVNLPEIQLPEFGTAHRIMHIHENVKGILAQINQVLAEHNINIAGQYLKTNDHIGYVITDIESDHPKELETVLKNIPNTIRFRILY